MNNIERIIEAWEAKLAEFEAAHGYMPKRRRPVVRRRKVTIKRCECCKAEFTRDHTVEVDGRRICRTCARRAKRLEELRAHPAYQLVAGFFADTPNKYAMTEQVIQALDEGRVDPEWAAQIGYEQGEHCCAVCGLRHWLEDDALDCCDAVDPCSGEVDKIGWRGPGFAGETEGVPDRPAGVWGDWV